MILGGLDIATVTGAAVMKDGVITTETIKLPARKKNILDSDKANLDANRLGDEFSFFQTAIRIWLLKNRIERVAIEEPLRTNFERSKTVVDTETEWAGKAVRKEKMAGMPMGVVFKLYGLEAVAAMVCRELNVPVEFVNQTTWRKSFLGNGRPKDAKKEAKLMCDRLGIKTTTLDSAEAAGIVYFLNQKINPNSGRDLFAQRQPTFQQMSAREAAEQLFRKA